MSFSVGLSRTSLPVDTTFIVISHIFAPKNVHHSHNLTPALSLSLLEIEPCFTEASAKVIAQFEQN